MSTRTPTTQQGNGCLWEKPFHQRRFVETPADLQTLIASREKRSALITAHVANLNAAGPIHVTLIACSANKLAHPAPAKELYTGQLFQKARVLTENCSDQYFILSALHGLLNPEKIIAPYNYTLKNLNQRERNGWGDRIVRDTLWRIPANSRITLLAGNDYCNPIEAKLRQKGFYVTRPLKGLPIGKQLQTLTRMLTNSF